MRIATLIVYAVTSVVSLFAEDRAGSGATIVGYGTTTFAEMARRAHAAHAADRNGISSNAAFERSEINLVFPVAGKAGAFSTEIVLVNRVPRAQLIDVYYLPAGKGVENCNLLPVRIRLEADTANFFTDFIGEVFKTDGFGSLILYSVRSEGGPDFTAAIDGNARIWSPAPGGGTASQTFSATTLDAASGTNSAFGLRSDESFRTNWGIFNADTRDQTFLLTFDGPRASSRRTVTIPACSMIQDVVGGGPYGPLVIGFSRSDSGGNFYSFASSVDNTSTDAWNVPGRK